MTNAADGTRLPKAATQGATLVLTKKVPVDGGIRQVTLYRLSAGGYAVQTLHRLPAGSTYLEDPSFYQKATTARTAMKAALR